MMFDEYMCGYNNRSNFFCLSIDIYDFVLHTVHEQKCKNANSRPRCQHFGSN
jgi:hypothetical protein